MQREKQNLVNQQNNSVDQASPLMYAVLAKNLENCKLILQNIDKGSKKGNDGKIISGPNAQDNMGNTAMHFAIMTSDLEIVKLLDSKGADPTVRNGSYQSSIELAIADDKYEIAAYFMGQHKYQKFLK